VSTADTALLVAAVACAWPSCSGWPSSTDRAAAPDAARPAAAAGRRPARPGRVRRGLLARVEHVESRADHVEQGLQQVTGRLDGVLQRWALLRYDALEGTGGRQSVSLALLDAGPTG
jgi:hypothetical protein